MVGILKKEKDRRRAWHEIKTTCIKPYVIIGSPPCTLFSNLQELNKYLHCDDPEWLRHFEEVSGKAIQHIELCMVLYRFKFRQGLHFIKEHPWGASSWKLRKVQVFIEDGRVTVAEIHMCRLGMDSHTSKKDGGRGLVKKPTGLMTSLKFVAAQLAKQMRGRARPCTSGGR